MRVPCRYSILLLCALISQLLLELTEAANDNKVRIYPRRTEEEAAVVEWGHSAIISALDASVAHFGPQTNQAALLEVEAKPVLASPVNGMPKKKKKSKKEGTGENKEDEQQQAEKLTRLDNADEVDGNLVVMTNMQSNLSGIEMAKLAQNSGAAALLVVNVDEEHPEDIYRLPAEEGADEITIPVVMISLNSANVLTTASVTPEMKKRDIVNNGMPERVRLYAGGDRPFFEDVEAIDPTVYLIHNLLTEEECDSLVKKAAPRVSPVTEKDSLQLTEDYRKFHDVNRVMLWQGMLRGPEGKQIEERIEQVTGFPVDHFSDFIIDRLDKGSHWKKHYDIIAGGILPMATIFVYLTEDPDGGELLYTTAEEETIKIRSRKGMAVVHHNADEENGMDMNAAHELLSASRPLYVARKFVFAQPVSKARRIVLPLVALPFGGKLPRPVISVYEFFVKQFGDEQGGAYFDKACVLVPVFIILVAAQWIVERTQRKMKESSSKSKKKKA